MALRLSEESAILSLKALLKNFPSGLHVEEVNHTFAKRFGTALDPLSYNHFTLKDFLQSVADKDKSFTIDKGKIKLCQTRQNEEFSNEIEAVECTKAKRRPKKIGSNLPSTFYGSPSNFAESFTLLCLLTLVGNH